MLWWPICFPSLQESLPRVVQSFRQQIEHHREFQAKWWHFHSKYYLSPHFLCSVIHSKKFRIDESMHKLFRLNRMLMFWYDINMNKLVLPEYLSRICYVVIILMGFEVRRMIGFVFIICDFFWEIGWLWGCGLVVKYYCCKVTRNSNNGSNWYKDYTLTN